VTPCSPPHLTHRSLAPIAYPGRANQGTWLTFSAALAASPRMPNSVWLEPSLVRLLLHQTIDAFNGINELASHICEML
jgi:hypothetical protein